MSADSASKKLRTDKPLVASLVLLAALGAGVYGVEVDEATQATVTDTVLQAVTALTGLFVLVRGLVVARKR